MPHDLNIVLIEPEIPQNTGTIGRLCLGVQATLHLIEPLGFDISDKAVRRAGLDYWQYLKLVVHKSTDAFLASLPADVPIAFFEKEGGNTIYNCTYQKGMYLVFGRETSGIPDWVLNSRPHLTLRIPMYDARVRSLNLAQSVAIVAYEAIRQLGE